MSERGARIRRCEWAKLGKTEIETVLLCLATTGQLHFANCLLYCLLHCLSQIADCGLQIADCELRIANCELRIANCELSIVHCLPDADCLCLTNGEAANASLVFRCSQESRVSGGHVTVGMSGTNSHQPVKANAEDEPFEEGTTGRKGKRREENTKACAESTGYHDGTSQRQ